MQKGLVIIGLLCCAAPICCVNEALSAWVDEVEMNAMERVLSNQWG